MDCVEVLAAESRWIAEEMDEISASRPLHLAIVDRLVALGERMKPAAVARDRLTNLDPAQLQAGIDL